MLFDGRAIDRKSFTLEKPQTPAQEVDPRIRGRGFLFDRAGSSAEPRSTGSSWKCCYSQSETHATASTIQTYEIEGFWRPLILAKTSSRPPVAISSSSVSSFPTPTSPSQNPPSSRHLFSNFASILCCTCAQR